MKNKKRVILAGAAAAFGLSLLAGCSPTPDAAASPSPAAVNGAAPAADTSQAAPGAPKGVPEVKPGMAGVPASK